MEKKFSTIRLVLLGLLCTACAESRVHLSTPLGPLHQVESVAKPVESSDPWVQWQQRWSYTFDGLGQGWAVLKKEALPQINAIDPELGRVFLRERPLPRRMRLDAVHLANQRLGLKGLSEFGLPPFQTVANDPRFKESSALILPWYSVSESWDSIGLTPAHAGQVKAHMTSLGYPEEGKRYYHWDRVSTAIACVTLAAIVINYAAAVRTASDKDDSGRIYGSGWGILLLGIPISGLGVGTIFSALTAKSRAARDFNRALARDYGGADNPNLKQP